MDSVWTHQIKKEKGRGLAIIPRSYLKTREIMEGNQKIFQYAVWKVETHGNSVTCNPRQPNPSGIIYVLTV